MLFVQSAEQSSRKAEGRLTKISPNQNLPLEWKHRKYVLKMFVQGIRFFFSFSVRPVLSMFEARPVVAKALSEMESILNSAPTSFSDILA